MNRAPLAGKAITRLFVVEGMSAQMLGTSEAFIAAWIIANVVFHDYTGT